MKHSCFVRRIDELGRVVLPVEIRQRLNIKEKDPLEISIKDNGVFIKKTIPSCVFCNSTVRLKCFANKNICKKCITKLRENDFNE